MVATLSRAHFKVVDAGPDDHSNDMAALNLRALQAMLAAIDVLNFALERLQTSCGSLPEGVAKEKLVAEKRRIAFTLYEVRMITLRMLPDRAGFAVCSSFC